MSKFTWGDSVRTKVGAPESARPGADAEVVGVRTIEHADQAHEFGTAVGSHVCTIEFGDGASVEVGEDWLEADPT